MARWKVKRTIDASLSYFLCWLMSLLSLRALINNLCIFLNWNWFDLIVGCWWCWRQPRKSLTWRWSCSQKISTATTFGYFGLVWKNHLFQIFNLNCFCEVLWRSLFIALFASWISGMIRLRLRADLGCSRYLFWRRARLIIHLNIVKMMVLVDEWLVSSHEFNTGYRWSSYRSSLLIIWIGLC